MRGGGVDATRKGERQAKGVHYRGGAIFGRGVDQRMGTAVRMGMAEIIQRRGW